MPIEYFDILDCTGKKTGRKIPRDEAHRAGTWHGAFHCLIIYERDGRQYALFQLRSKQKKIAPGKFDVSVGGHYTSGENAASAGPREIREELGIEIKFSDLFPVGRRILIYCFEPGIKEYEFQDIFLLPRPISPEQLILQRDEVDGLLELEIELGVKLFSGELKVAQGQLITPGNKTENIKITAQDFVSSLDNYYLKLLLISRQYFAGERLLVI